MVSRVRCGQVVLYRFLISAFLFTVSCHVTQFKYMSVSGQAFDQSLDILILTDIKQSEDHVGNIAFYLEIEYLEYNPSLGSSCT